MFLDRLERLDLDDPAEERRRLVDNLASMPLLDPEVSEARDVCVDAHRSILEAEERQANAARLLGRYDADEVPVGDDQRQHVEITRDIALRFNHRFGETFVIPKAVMPAAGARVMDLLEPTSKMSKSADTDRGLVQLLDDPASIARKFKRAVTDSETEVRYDPVNKPGVSNLLEILAAATGKTPAEVARGYTQYGPLKADAGEAVIEMLAPIQTRYHELMADRGELSSLLHKGAEKARAVASVTLQRAYDAVGLLRP